jgi:sensor histidine kinase YesM
VCAARADDILVLTVTDDGPGLPDDVLPAGDGQPSAPAADVAGVGLQNIAERLDGLYGDAASLAFERAQGGGLRVVIRLPFRTPESDHTLRTSGVVAD